MKRGRYRRRASSRRIWVSIITPIALAVAVAAGGALLSYYQTRKVSVPLSNTAQKVNATKEALPSHLDSVLPASTVQELATNAGGSAVANMALENHSGVLVYTVTLGDGTKLGFNATSGDAVNLQDNTTPPATTGKKTAADNKNTLPANFTINTSFEEARKLAQVAFPTDQISQIQLNTENDLVTMSVKFADNAQVDINAASSTVLRVTTPNGATAEVPSDTNSTPTLPVTTPTKNPSDTSSDTQSSSHNSSDSTAPDTTDKVNNKTSGKASIHVEGDLVLADGIYTITQNDTTYTIQTDDDISSLVGKNVRVEGKLQADNTIVATHVQLLHD